MPTKLFRQSTALTLLLLTAACGGFTYRADFTSRSPDGSAEIRVMRNRPHRAADYYFRIEVSNGRSTRVIFSRELDSMVGLVEAHWTSNGDRVGILVCEMFGGPVFVSYDLANRASLPPLLFRSAIEQQIVAKYALAGGEGVLSWACSHQGNAAYQKLR